MVAVTIREAPSQWRRSAQQRPRLGGVLIALGIAFLVALADGYIAFVIESPGTSLAGHCLLVAAVAAFVAAAGWWVSRQRNRSVAWIFGGAMVLIGMLVVWWAWAFAMPAAMAWDSHATTDAQSALRGLPPDKSVCVQFDHGSIGPLSAPYTRCAIIGPPAPTVEYSATAADPGRGLFFVDGRAGDVAGFSTRHLVGGWYAYTQDPAGVTGYTFVPGA